MKRLLPVAGSLALVCVAAVWAELPPMPAFAAWSQQHDWPFMMATGVSV